MNCSCVMNQGHTTPKEHPTDYNFLAKRISNLYDKILRNYPKVGHSILCKIFLLFLQSVTLANRLYI